MAFPSLPNLTDITKSFDAAIARVVYELRALRIALVKGHLENVDKVESFLAFKTVTVAPGASAEVVVVRAVNHKRGYIKGLANVVEEPDRWADDNLAGGVFFQVLIGGQVRPGLERMNSPFGTIGARGRVTIPFDSSSPVTIVARNTHASETLTVCVQVNGYFEEGLGPGLEGVGPQNADRRAA